MRGELTEVELAGAHPIYGRENCKSQMSNINVISTSIHPLRSDQYVTQGCLY